MQRTLAPRWLKPYRSGIAGGGREREPPVGGGEGCWLVEEAAELLADLASAGFALFPLVGVDAEGGVGLAVAEAALDVDERGRRARCSLRLAER